jgi:hypothetical protein
MGLCVSTPFGRGKAPKRTKLQTGSLTFGIEIELILEVTLSTQQLALGKDPERHIRATYEVIHNALRSSNIAVRLVKPEASESPATELEYPYGSWMIRSDDSLHSNRLPASGQVNMGVEIVSRYLPFAESSYAEIRQVLAILHALPDIEIFFNDTCSLHVHIGLSDSSVLPIETARRIAQLAMAYEHLTDRMIPPAWRDGGRVYRHYSSRLTQVSPAFKRLVREGQYAKISSMLEGCKTHRHLVEMCHPLVLDEFNRYTAVNLVGLCANNALEHGTKPTIEFRRWGATVNAEEICHTVKFLGRLVESGGETSGDEFVRFVMLGWVQRSRMDRKEKDETPEKKNCDKKEEASNDLESFLASLGCEESTVNFFKHRDWSANARFYQGPFM